MSRKHRPKDLLVEVSDPHREVRWRSKHWAVTSRHGLVTALTAMSALHCSAVRKPVVDALRILLARISSRSPMHK